MIFLDTDLSACEIRNDDWIYRANIKGSTGPSSSSAMERLGYLFWATTMLPPWRYNSWNYTRPRDCRRQDLRTPGLSPNYGSHRYPICPRPQHKLLEKHWETNYRPQAPTHLHIPGGTYEGCFFLLIALQPPTRAQTHQHIPDAQEPPLFSSFFGIFFLSSSLGRSFLRDRICSCIFLVVTFMYERFTWDSGP